MHVFHDISDRSYTELTLIFNTHITKSLMHLLSPEMFEAFSTNSVNPDQTAV